MNPLEDELSHAGLWLVSREHFRLFERNVFGTLMAEKFPSTILDIEEAGKCLAFGRSTACVFHLMRVVEVGLNRLAASLGVDFERNPNWDSILKKVNRVIEQKVAADPQWKEHHFFSEASAYLFNVKNAWRNPTMHVAAVYDPERAQDIFNAVKSLMRHLATKLSESIS